MPIQTKNLSDLSGVSHGFFTREGGVSEGIYASLNCGPGSKDDGLRVAENRARVAEAISGSKETPLCTLYQIHSPDVITLLQPWEHADAPKADAMVTKQKNVVLGVLTADCTPVLFADAKAGVIGCAHAGWKGALSGIIRNTIEAMESLGATRANIHASIGACIAQDSYEVGEEFMQNFLQQSTENKWFFLDGAPGKYWFDLPAYVRSRLEKEAIASIGAVGEDTYMEEERYFSFRRTTHNSEADYGRQISAICLL